VYIKKKINNNVVLSHDGQRYVILMGKGIGFNAYPGDLINEAKIERKYYSIGNFTIEDMAAVIMKAKKEEIDVVNEIIVLYNTEFNNHGFNNYFFFALLDHIKFAVERSSKNIEIHSPLEFEVKKIYKKEYSLALNCIALINKRLNVHLPPCEACSIALHFVNLQIEKGSMTKTMEITEIIQDILRIIKIGWKTDINENSVHYNRFITHLRYYLIRQMEKENEEYYFDQEFYANLKSKYPEEYNLIEKIQEYLMLQKNWKISDSEKMFLLIHLSNLKIKIKEQDL